MQQQQTNFQTLICSLNTSELQTLILQLSESDASYPALNALQKKGSKRMKELYPLAEITERADAELLRQLIHSLADKDPIVRRECLDFLRQKLNCLLNPSLK